MNAILYIDFALNRDGTPRNTTLWIHSHAGCLDDKCIMFNGTPADAMKLAAMFHWKIERRFSGPRYRGLLWWPGVQA